MEKNDIILDDGLKKFIKLAVSAGYSSNFVPQKVINKFIKILIGNDKEKIKKISSIITSKAFLSARKNYKDKMIKSATIYKYIKKYISGGKVVLDAGCGDGGMGHLINNYDKDSTYIGTEIVLQKNIKTRSSNFKIIRQNSEIDIPVKNDSVDVALMIDMIHHTPYNKQKELLKRVSRKLKKNGKLIIFEFTFPFKNNFIHSNRITNNFSRLNVLQKFEYMSFIDELGNISVSKSEMPMPQAYRTSEEWKNKFKECGYKIKYYKYIGFIERFFHQGSYCLFVLERNRF